tara:strand:- start:232 stop:405 length:174 start_codon:yes stop_codon:yes gene_type:complete
MKGKEHKGKPTITSGFLNFTKPPSDDDWDDIDEQEALEDGVDDYIITRGKKSKTIED